MAAKKFWLSGSYMRPISLEGAMSHVESMLSDLRIAWTASEVQLNRIVTKPTRIDLHIHSAASTATKDKGKKELADCDKGHVDVLLRGLEAHGINMCAITDHDCFDKDLYFALKEREGMVA